MSDSFMQMEIYPKGYGYRVETSDGTFFYPCEVFNVDDIRREHGDDCEIEEVCGYFGRYSAPGYLDCTDWHFDTNKRRLARELKDFYGED